MKKLIVSLLSTILLVLVCTGCNKTMFDTTYKFDKAIISLPDDTIVSGKVESWTDYEDGDQIQLKIDGVVYLVHSSNVVLVNE